MGAVERQEEKLVSQSPASSGSVLWRRGRANVAKNHESSE